jgi:hypothetical protein
MLLAGKAVAQPAQKTNFIKLSQDFLYAARTDGDTKAYIDTLANANEKDIADQLTTDERKKAFFINIYHAYTQAILKKDPTKYNNRSEFFKKHQIYMAGNYLSLDKIEHGLLRHSKVKWNFGYVGKMIPGQFEKRFRVSKVDYRIHFTLNCGAKSCPPIAYYTPENLEEELNIATKSYLHDEASYDAKANVVHLPAQMRWFRADFGGKKGELQICRDLGIIPKNANPTISYNKYNWGLYLNNYKNT